MRETGTVEDYLKRACQNEELASLIEKQAKKDVAYYWAIVLRYYAAYHYFCAFLAKDGEFIPTNHTREGTIIDPGDVPLAEDRFYTSLPNGKAISMSGYGTLYNWSCEVRYKHIIPSGFSLHLKESKNLLDDAKIITMNKTRKKACYGIGQHTKKKITIIAIKTDDDLLKEIKIINNHYL